MTTLLAVLLVGGGSYALRASPTWLRRHLSLPAALDRAAALAATAALASVMTSAVLGHERGNGPAHFAAIVATAGSLLLARRRISMLPALAAGWLSYSLFCVLFAW